ncbi:MAG: SPFH/Band 7/PHB domain protein [Candidatus Paracaedimonas acanthamoebae]|uniref:Protein QmcA n=1 Tax=Candidatus Paracaedimonas acanthamoebae TaxID=244581 RepID=A0A8J7PQZ7_9PROT|nr:SPFH/Band 7/PHB domain protein [Candidatus Paracaedimonas acanthamoebae]
MDFSLTFEFLFLALTFLFVLLAVKSVPQGYEWTVERFGRYIRTLEPGLNFIIPFIDRIGAKVSMQENVFDVPSQDIITQDNAMLKVDGVVFYQVLDAAKSAYEVANIDRAMINLAMTNIRTVMGGMDMDELLSNREKINTSLLHVIDDATTPWGVKVTRVEIKDITPPRDLVDAMARQMKAEREKRATVLEAEGEKQSAILIADGAKQSAILEAEGRKEAAYREAEARERLAEAEARAIEVVSLTIAKGNPQAVNYFIAQKYVDALQTIGAADNQKVLFLPLEATSIIGSIGGISEIAKEAFLPKKSSSKKDN